MSWNNILPWFIWYHEAWERAALRSCAFPDEFHVSEFRDDFFP